MIRIDRKVTHDILKLTKSYDSSIIFDPAIDGYAFWRAKRPESAKVKSSVPNHEVAGSLNRLVDRGMIDKVQSSWSGAIVFRITPELVHAKAFWFDRVTKKFIGGVVTGACATAAGDIIFHVIRSLI